MDLNGGKIYIYIYKHKIFFTEFPSLLQKLIKRRVEINTICHSHIPVIWDRETLERLKIYLWTHAINYWFEQVKEGYIVEFVIYPT